MKRHFYIGEGPENDALFVEVKKLEGVGRMARKKLQKDFEADGLYSMGDNKVVGLVFKGKQAIPFLKREVCFGDDEYGYTPRRNTKKGKELARRLEEEQELHFDAGRYIRKKLGVYYYQRKGGRWYETIAGYAYGKILVCIPGQDGEISDPLPEVPGWLREVKESEWLAAQGR